MPYNTRYSTTYSIKGTSGRLNDPEGVGKSHVCRMRFPIWYRNTRIWRLGLFDLLAAERVV
jgi:hypothetical protein